MAMPAPPLAPLAASRAAFAASVIALVALTSVLLTPSFPWLVEWPDAWRLPISEGLDAVMAGLLGALKPLARGVAALISYPLSGANALLTGLSPVLLIGGATALGWVLGGLSLAALACLGLGFVLASGFWVESMNTLSLVTISVPMAISAGLFIGVLGFEFPPARRVILAVLDFMQTVPTFAYLLPMLVLFGFGAEVGLVASSIYAAPPMARNVLLGLDRNDEELREAASMSGATRLQSLLLIELPAARRQIMVGLNQCIMAALSMVIIAAVIGGFQDIGWEVLQTLRKAQFADSLLAGLIVVVFAVVIDRMSASLSRERPASRPEGLVAIAACTALGLLLFGDAAARLGTLGVFGGMVDRLDAALTSFSTEHGAALNALKNTVMYFGLLPVRIGLDGAVLPFTWGVAWTPELSWAVIGGSVALGAGLFAAGYRVAGPMLVCACLTLLVGVTHLPWVAVLTAVLMVGWVAGGLRLGATLAGLMTLVLTSGLWAQALLSLYLAGVSVVTCAVLGGAIGLLCATSATAWRLVRPVCDMLQTIPLFVFLIPALMFFQVGEFSAYLAICAYAIVPMIRYTQHGISTTPPDLIEAAEMSGATGWQTLRDVRIPYAVPALLLGLNQTILYAFAMLVIAALVGTSGLGQQVYIALADADVGLGLTAGISMAIMALVADRLIQGFAEERRKALGM